MDTEETIPDLVNIDTDNNSLLFTADVEILLGILPSNVWADTFKKIEKKHPSSLENLSNSSLYFRNVILSKRVLFLFPQVIKLIGPEFASQKNTTIDGSTIIKSRIVCKQWNTAVDQFIISDTLQPDFFNSQPPQPSDHALINARYQYFGDKSPTKLPEFLFHFEQTHSPHSSRNPFIGKVVHIDFTSFSDRAEMDFIADQVSTLLRKYGHHIKILNLGLFMYHRDRRVRFENHVLLESLGHCPNVTHLKVSEGFNINGEMDVAFGERPDDRGVRREEFGNFHGRLAHRIQMRAPMEQQMMPDFFGDPRVLLPAPPFENRVEAVFGPRGRMDHHNEPRPLPQAYIDYMHNTVDVYPNSLYTLKNLQCLKLCKLSFLYFNILLSANTHVIWLHVESLDEDKQMYIDYQALQFPNLKKLYIRLCSPAEVRKLRGVHKSWLQLTHLHFEYCASFICSAPTNFMEWIEVFGVIYQQWGDTLTDLKLRLPMAWYPEEREKIVRDSGNFRLYLPRLKRLKIWLSGRPEMARVAKLDFLDLMRVGLEQLIIE